MKEEIIIGKNPVFEAIKSGRTINKIIVSDKLNESLFQRIKQELKKDRKSTRLNSSHVANSYAVFCLKKKINVTIGDVLIQQQRANSLDLKIIEISSVPSLDIGSSHPNYITLKVTKLSSAPHLNRDKT